MTELSMSGSLVLEMLNNQLRRFKLKRIWYIFFQLSQPCLVAGKEIRGKQ